ncbi:hypothetical protein, partial [Marisediminitalea sp.]|uniref:hypothetical protein n=2 Tax=Marisediminitalea sp. TaxID=2662268 RepID=UPI003514F698
VGLFRMRVINMSILALPQIVIPKSAKRATVIPESANNTTVIPKNAQHLSGNLNKPLINPD